MFSRSVRRRLVARTRRVSRSARLRRQVARVTPGTARMIRFGDSRLAYAGVAGNTVQARMRAGSEMPMFAPRAVRSRRPMHYSDVASASYACDTTGSVTLLPTSITTGDVLQATQQGSRWMWYSVQLRGQFEVLGSTVLTKGCFLIVYDRAPRGAAPAVTDILETASANAFQNTQYRDRFEIVYRRDVALEGSTAAPSSDSTRHIDVNVRVNRPCRMTLEGTPTYNLANIAGVISGCLWLVTAGISVGAAACQLTAGVRVQYYLTGV